MSGRSSSWILLIALIALGSCYLFAFALFVSDSRDFIVAHQNRTALQHAAAGPGALPKQLRFFAGSTDLALLGGGWHLPDHEGVFSQLNDSWIALDLRDAKAGTKVTLDTDAFVARHRKAITIDIDIDGHALGSWRRTRVNKANPLEFCIPAAIARARDVLLHVHVDSISSPLEIGAGRDSRRFGLMITSLSLGAPCASDSLPGTTQ